MVGSVYQPVVNNGVLSFQVMGDGDPGVVAVQFLFGSNQVSIAGQSHDVSTLGTVAQLDLSALAAGSTVSFSGFGLSSVDTISTGAADIDIALAGSEADGRSLDGAGAGPHPRRDRGELYVGQLRSERRYPRIGGRRPQPGFPRSL